MLKVSRQPSGEPEIFHSVQGEGVTAGEPAVFLRLATCNLACTWCDTRYTWDWANYEVDEQVMPMSAEEVEQRVTAFGTRRLVITGGEPMLQQRELATLAASLRDRGYTCEVETNGTLEPRPEMAAAVSQWNVSPKLTNSGNDHARREVRPSLNAFAALDNAYFKFVIVEPGDVDEVSLLAGRYQLEPGKVILMPEGVTAEVLNERGSWLAEVCRDKGYRFSTRLHIQLWGDVRGR